MDFTIPSGEETRESPIMLRPLRDDSMTSIIPTELKQLQSESDLTMNKHRPRTRLDAALQAARAMDGLDIPTDTSRLLRSCSDLGPYSETIYDKCEGLFSTCITTDGNSVLLGTGNGSIIRRTFGGQPHDETLLQSRANVINVIMTIKRHPTERDYAFAADIGGNIYGCKLAERQCDVIANEDDNVIASIDVVGSMMITGGSDTHMRVYDTTTFNTVRQYQGYQFAMPNNRKPGHSSRIFAVRFHPDRPNVCLSGGWDDSIKVWDLGTKHGVVQALPGPHICGEGIDALGDLILSASWTEKNSLQMWDLRSCRVIDTIPVRSRGHGEFLYCGQFCSPDVALVGGSGANSVQAINFRSKQFLREIQLDKTIGSISFSPTSSRFAAVSLGGRLVVGLCKQ